MFRLSNIVCLLVCANIEAARILAVFPHPAISHQATFRPFTQELARRGHEVVVITPDPAFPKGETPVNLTEIDVHDISYGTWKKTMAQMSHGDQDDFRSKFDLVHKALRDIFKKQTENPDVKEIIKNHSKKFDLLILQTSYRQTLGYSHVFKVPVIGISSFGAIYDDYDIIGAPSHPILYPGLLNTRVYNLSLWDKLSMYYYTFAIQNLLRNTEEKDNSVIKRIFGEDTPGVGELVNNIDMIFFNTYPVWEGNHPLPPSVIHIGGINWKPQRELPQDLKKYLDLSKHGVIYLSFGSTLDTSTLPAEKVQAIINVFSQLPYDVLWKWNQDELPGRTKNIKISKWFPQSDLLRHPKVKLFITQGGLQSTHEAIFAGVPVIGIPMYADQWKNVEKYVYHKIGKQLNLIDLNEDRLKDAIESVIEDESYRENVVRLSSLMEDQPMSPLERAVWWTEHVLRHGGRHLRAPAANMSCSDYYELKLVLLVLGVLTTAILLVSLALYKTVRFFLSLSRDKVKRS